uniref:Peptidase S1 domain-containing protein n=1 Tax=Rhodnius prolixus TaxID=13249 RepID=T1H9W2_RHOPR
MRAVIVLVVLALVSSTLATEDDWAWKKKEGEDNAAEETPAESKIVGVSTEVPPASANETHARHFIKDRLCDLGLGGVSIEAKQESSKIPHDLIYAQPVHLKPVGHPIPAVPVRGPPVPPPISSSGGYGPPRPVPYRPRPPYKPIAPPLHTPSVYEPDRDHSILLEKRPLVTGPSGAGGVQTHVHHHYHHDDEKLPALHTGSGGLYDSGNSLQSGVYSPGSSYNHYPFYKKQLNVKQPHALGGVSGPVGQQYPYEKYPPYEPNRGTTDCYCVPYEQCPPHEIARKEDHRGPTLIDPRNNANVEIQALGPDEVVITDGNGTMTVVKQKRQLEDDADQKVRKLAGLGGGGINEEDGDSGLKLRPTFGVSFGLPSGAQGYPLNPWSHYPAVNPYGSSVGGPGGVNLGLVSVNPLLSVQVTKDEYGDKVVKPLVNLHVTPNHGLVNKIGSFIHHLKEPYYGHPPPYLSHHHLHVHKIPSHHYAHKPTFHPYAPHYSYPSSSYGPSHHYHGPPPSFSHPHYHTSSSSSYIRDSDDYIDDEEDSYYRSSSSAGSRSNISTDSSNKIAFPEDRASELKRCRGGEYPWQVAVLKKDPQESVYVCGGTLIDALHVLTAAHCIKSYTAYELRVRLGEWDVNHDVEFFPYEERDVAKVQVHPEFYAGTLYNDLAILRLERPASMNTSPHISPACLPDPHADFSGSRCWTTGWGKDAFGDYGKYQNILKNLIDEFNRNFNHM